MNREPGVDAPAQKVLIYRDESRFIAQRTRQYPNTETGGSLFGYWTHSGAPVVVLASGPGLGSRHSRTSFFQDESYLHDAGTELYDRHGIQHIGEWHSHHRLGLHEPSSGDVHTIWTGLRQHSWSRFLLLITTIEDHDLVLKNYYLFSTDQPAPAPLRILSLPGSSPFRTGDVDPREEMLPPGFSPAWSPGPNTPGGHRRGAREQFPESWFTSSEGRQWLVNAMRGFGDAGLDCKVFLSSDGRSARIRFADSALVLGPEFPRVAASWEGDAEEPAFGEWNEDEDIVRWYLAAVPRAASTELAEQGESESPTIRPPAQEEGGELDENPA